MRGDPGDSAIYVDQKGEEYRAVIQSETMIGNANLVFWEGQSPDKDDLKIAMNVPHTSNSNSGRNVYRHKPSADWAQKLL